MTKAAWPFSVVAMDLPGAAEVAESCLRHADVALASSSSVHEPVRNRHCVIRPLMRRTVRTQAASRLAGHTACALQRFASKKRLDSCGGGIADAVISLRGSRMGFSIKVAPGVRVRASSRGIRTSMGPRAARIHVGGGRAGFSTGAGPVGYYTSLSTGSRGSSATRRPSPGASQRALAQADKLEQAEELQHALLVLLNLHRHEFAQAMPPRAPEPPQVDTAAVLKEHEKVALQGLSVFKREARKQARAAATASAQRETAQLEAQRREQWTQHQQQLDQWWTALVGNDPEVVLSTLTAAFEDNEAPAAAVGIDGTDVALVTLVPTIDTLPDRKPATTPAGNLTLKRLTKKERGTLHNAVVASHVLLTVRETFVYLPRRNTHNTPRPPRCAPTVTISEASSSSLLSSVTKLTGSPCSSAQKPGPPAPRHRLGAPPAQRRCRPRRAPAQPA